MADSSLSVNAAVAAETFRRAMLPDMWKASDDSGFHGKWQRWKDRIDEAVLALQAGEMDPDATRPRVALDGAEELDDSNFATSGWDTDGIDPDTEQGSTIAKFHFDVTPSSEPTANPTVTVTWPTPLSAAPKMVIPVLRLAQAPVHSTVTGWVVIALTTTLCTLMALGTPAEAETVGCDCLVIF